MEYKPRVCLESTSGAELPVFIFSSLIAGCTTAVEGCDVSIRRVENGFIIQRGLNKVRVCKGGSGVCDIKINVEAEGFFLHSTTLGGVEYSFATEKPIDPDVFTSLLSCLLAKGYGVAEAFSETTLFFTLGGGDFYETIRRSIKENRLINNLLLNVEWIELNSTALGKMGLKEVLVGARLIDKIILFRFNLDNIGLVGLRIEVNLNHNSFHKIPPNNCFLCLSSINLDLFKYGYSTIGINGYTCVFGEDITNALSLLVG